MRHNVQRWIDKTTRSVLVCSGWISSCTHRFTLDNNPVISHERGKENEIVTRTNGTYPVRYCATVNQVVVVTVKRST